MKAQIYNFSGWIKEVDSEKLRGLMNDILEKSGFNVLNYVDHEYAPEGYTAVWLLSESHFAVHSFPEEDKTYIELSSCNEIKNNRFIELISKYIIDGKN
ncbi:MAG: S-adenosylmethionine decarboxylase [Bacteroidales bacterium]|nr:S-adenosylmethionine decarboxylase [Bacteroidales bacterium]